MEKSPYVSLCDQDFETDPLPIPVELIKVK